MKVKEFDTNLNIYKISTPIMEQISIWLDTHKKLTIKEVQISSKKAILYYT